MRATVLWPCGHTEVLELAWLPDPALRERKAYQAVLRSQCLACSLPGPEHGQVGGGELRPFPTRVAPVEHGRQATTQAGFDELISDGQAWVEVASQEEVLVEWVEDHQRVDIAPGASAIVAGPGPVVRSWGYAAVKPGGRVAGGPGSRTVLAGGLAAVCQDGTLVAATGTGIVDAGARLTIVHGALNLEVWALPWAVIVTGGRVRVVTDQPWGIVLDHSGQEVSAGGPANGALIEVLEICRSMPLREDGV